MHVQFQTVMQDEVEIIHQEGDEVVRKADVDVKIIRQVDQLVEYFNSLFHDDQLDIRWGLLPVWALYLMLYTAVMRPTMCAWRQPLQIMRHAV